MLNITILNQISCYTYFIKIESVSLCLKYLLIVYQNKLSEFNIHELTEKLSF